MAFKWIKTKHTGLRYREHPTRKHGKVKDRFYQYRHTVDGERKEEGLGWWSKGWSELECLDEIVKIQKAKVTGEDGPVSIRAKRKKASEARKKAKKDALTVSDAWEKTAPGRPSYDIEDGYFRLWIKPVLGKKALNQVSVINLERIRSNMEKDGKAPRTIQYVQAIIRRLFNDAKRLDLYNGENPASKVRKPKFDNKRQRFLTRDEAAALLADLKERSTQLYNMTLLSLHTGMRAGEIFSLIWADVDKAGGRITIRDPKSTKTRFAYMTDEVKAMFEEMKEGDPGELVFPDRNGNRMKQISNAFNTAVDDLKLNENAPKINKKVDRRFKVVFHTIRHTFASWLVQDGVDLFTVKELLGHSDFAMTARYSHLSPHTLQAAVKRLSGSLTPPAGAENNQEEKAANG
jgi:integrase